jgi:predicted Fe-Mo cluster-binding NifX family protein
MPKAQARAGKSKNLNISRRVVMIITMPVDGMSIDARINKSFGRTPYFIVYDSNTNESKFLENSAATAQGGAGIKASQFVIDQTTDVVIAPMLGKNSADVLKNSGIKLYMASGFSIQDNIKAFSDGVLDTLTEIHTGFHQHGGK